MLRRFVASSLLFLLVSPALADTPRDLIEQGNEHFQAGRYAEALEAYEQVGDKPDELIVAELLHDKAAAHFKLGELDDARELWVRSAGLKDESFEAAARYNLGNCDYATALTSLQQARSQGPESGPVDVSGVIELLDRAIAEYRDALRLDPELLDARANLELAAQLKKQIEESAEQQPQSQPSSEQQQDQQNQSSSQPSSQPSESDQQNQDKTDSQDQQSEQNTEQQQEQEQQEQSQEPDSQPSPESQPTEQSEQQPSPEETREEEQQQVVPIEMTKEEAERLLQLIRDAERQRRAVLRAREAAGQKPVDKDW